MGARLRNKRTVICATLAAIGLMLVIAACGGEPNRDDVEGTWVGSFDISGRWWFIEVSFTGSNGVATIREMGIANLAVTDFNAKAFLGLKAHFAVPLDGDKDKIVFDEAQVSYENAPVVGSVQHGTEKGQFRLLKVVNPILTGSTQYDGNYEIGSRMLLVGDTSSPHYVDGDNLISIFPVQSLDNRGAPITNTFYTSLGETLTFTNSDGEITGLKLAPRDSTAPTLEGKRVGLYKSAAVSFQNGSVVLSGTLLLPNAPGPYAAVAIVPGDGAASRGGGYALADRFARAGIAALIYDKRGVGGSSGDWHSASLGDLGDDAAAAVRFLEGRSEVNPQQIGVVGMGQGSWVAGIAAARSPAVRFVIAVSASGVSPAAQELWRNQNNLRFAGFDVRQTGIGVKASSMAQNIGVQMANLGMPTPDWLRNLGFSSVGDLSRNPNALWYRVRQPTLLVYGGLDKLIPPLQSATVISAALKAGGNGNFTVRYFANANHDLMLAPSGYQHEVLPLDEYAPGYFDAITGWALARITDKPTPPSDRLPATDSSVATYVQLPFYGTAWVQLIVMLVFALIFLPATLVWTVAYLLRRRRHHLPSDNEAAPLLHFLAWVLAMLDVGVLLGVIAAIAAMPREDYSVLYWLLPTISWLAFISALLTITLVVANWLTHAFAFGWHQWQRFVFLGAAVAFVPFMLYWNLLGF